MTEKKGYLAVSKLDEQKFLKEEFQGEVIDEEVTFPKDLGAKHPFNFEDMENSFKKIGLISGLVNKIKDSIVGDFTVKTNNKNVQALLEGFIEDTNFSSVLREWIKEGILKGNGFIEIDLVDGNIRVLNANNMYVKRNKKGMPKEYNQWTGDMKNYNRKSKLFTNFKPNQIAHLKINKISNQAYAIGYIYPNERVFENIVKGEQDLHKLIDRKAGAQYHVKVGQPGESVRPEDIDDFANKLKFMNNRTEWVTDGNVEIKALELGTLGESLVKTIDHDIEMISAGMEIPMVLLGRANIAEGLAKVQIEAWQRKIKSIQEEVESVVEEKIFRPYLQSQGFDDVNIEFLWNLPGEEEINNRIEKIQKLLSTMNISENMQRSLELELARLLNLQDLENLLPQPEKGLEKEKEEEIEQPEVPGAKTTNQSHKQINEKKMKGCGCGQQLQEEQVKSMTIREWSNITEISGFNYTEYLVNILKRLKIDKFDNLRGLNEDEIDRGLFSQKEIKRFKLVLKDAFRKNKTIREIEEEVSRSIQIRDRIKKDGGIVPARDRVNMIVRSEVVRLANLGLLETYKEHKIERVRFLAALSERTCPECEILNGQIFNINEAEGMIPVHPRCRCSWLSVTG